MCCSICIQDAHEGCVHVLHAVLASVTLLVPKRLSTGPRPPSRRRAPPHTHKCARTPGARNMAAAKNEGGCGRCRCRVVGNRQNETPGPPKTSQARARRVLRTRPAAACAGCLLLLTSCRWRRCSWTPRWGRRCCCHPGASSGSRGESPAGWRARWRRRQTRARGCRWRRRPAAAGGGTWRAPGGRGA